MAEQELHLLQLASGSMAQAGTGTTEVVTGLPILIAGILRIIQALYLKFLPNNELAPTVYRKRSESKIYRNLGPMIWFALNSETAVISFGPVGHFFMRQLLNNSKFTIAIFTICSGGLVFGFKRNGSSNTG